MDGGSDSRLKPSWLGSSELPFFVVLKNNLDNLDQSATSSNPSLVPDDEHWLYPEVHYVFEDDDFSPTIDVLEQSKNDISVVIDFNEAADEVISYKSLSPSWQILNVSTESAATPTWRSDSNGRTCTMLLIEGTNSELNWNTNTAPVGGTKEEDDVDSLGDMKRLVESFKSRNEQLKQILFERSPDNGPRPSSPQP
ncbi:hypothetical protein AWJ20_1711 [Sugiyamaella lignohabitans]|uniref:Uncharacterized protein n=1 Tax=Sugiyamaella lignohabitans TaxID=796027 RepID=A0A167DXP8_9ASCO|nr:uncharacterized protein AWJ20_1711 [Sugiyamaella lignohabitans]ANB13420.1 hypothetical protein AWJ20_1711 [Sugiyamaella lignohabitans]